MTSRPDIHPVWHTCARLARTWLTSPALHTIEQMPDNFKESYILSGYRSPRSSPWQCLMSVFSASNETLNFWTHFLPAMYFWWQLVALQHELNEHWEYGHAMGLYMASICVFPAMSAIAHIFNTMSDRSRHICFFLDYASLGLYILGTAIGYRAYVFPRWMLGSWYAALYLYVAAVLGVVSLIVSCGSRFLPTCTVKKVMRMLGFMIPYFHISLPLMFRILLCEHHECSWSALFYLKRHFFFAFIAAVLFGTHVPERFYPGRFDIVGHSHQLFHVCSVMGTNDQMRHIAEDMLMRRDENLAFAVAPSAEFNVGLMAVVLMLNVVILAFFILQIYRFVPADRISKVHHHHVVHNNNNAKPTNATARHRKVEDSSRGD